MAKRVVASSGGGKIIVVGRKLYNEPRTTPPEEWLGGKKRKRSIGEAYVKMAPHYPNPSAHQRQIGSLGKECGAELKGKLKGRKWSEIKMAMAACVLIKQNKPVPDTWKRVYESIVRGA